MKKITEQASDYENLEILSTNELLRSINTEDAKVPVAVEQILPAIEAFIEACSPKMKQGGRLFYLGAGTSGRLGIVDASECPPTFGVPQGLVIGLIAGGDAAIRKAVEFAEDDRDQGWKDLLEHSINPMDTLVGIAASGTTPYVLGALEKANEIGVLTGGITCNPGSPLSQIARFPMVPVVGPEFVTGSTRMKSGTAQKLVLNMISTSLMVQLGRVKGNKMVDMQLSNDKLVDRAIRMVCEEIHVTRAEAKKLLDEHISVRASIDAYHNSKRSS
ncbi:MAG: N-acetylmuramic acid 6-phosphate etherase [Bacteroidetes bacterium]|nr:N-acetylmuramic acid 6-phosphate etherase [Bacteroidota bacterium]MBM3424355.1 N-acetylmuramic acid 6-phosphate etherase [Bacteroidota bacterium]